MLKAIAATFLLKSELERIASALERCASALEQAVPPVILPVTPVKKLEATDYRPASDSAAVEQETIDYLTLAEGPMDPEKEARVRQFVREQLIP